MNRTPEQQEILQKLQEFNAASEAFNVAELTLKKANYDTSQENVRIALLERAQAVERYVAAKEWLYEHVDDVVYDSHTNAFTLRRFQIAS